MGLEGGGWGEGEFAGLGLPVVVPGAVEVVDDGDVEGEVEVGEGVGGEEAVGVVVWGGEEDREGGGARGGGLGEVVGEVDEALAAHAFPGAVAGDAFGGAAAPEEGVFFGGEGGVGVGGVGGGVGHFVDVVPGGGVEDVGEAGDFALREYGQELVGCLEGGGAEVEAVEVAEIGLVAGGGAEGPVAEEGSLGMGRGA